MQETPFLEMRGIRKAFPGVVALDGVDFVLQRGEIAGLIGENGAGKSTLIKILSGVYQRDAGAILLEGRPVEIKNTADSLKLGFSFLYQELDLIPTFTVAENLMLGEEPMWKRSRFISGKELHTTARRILSDMGIEVDVTRPVDTLTPGEGQMVAIAKILIHRRKLIVLDEPTARLSREETEGLFRLVRTLHQHGVSIIYISQRLEEIFQITDSMTILRNGQVIRRQKTTECQADEVIATMIGRELTDRYPKADLTIGDKLLSVRDLTREDHENGATFDLHAGEILGIYGLVGAGKTELARMMFGIDPKAKGEVILEGREVNARTPDEAIGEGLALVPEERRGQGFIGTFSVAQNLSLPSLKGFTSRGLIRSGREVESARRNIRELKIHTPGPFTLTRFLSGGNQQKVVVGKWITAKAKVYICDEPTVGVDIGAKTEIYRLIQNLAKDGAGIVFISSEINEVLGICNRIVVMKGGQITLSKKTNETTADQVLSHVLTNERAKAEEAAPPAVRSVRQSQEAEAISPAADPPSIGASPPQ